MEQLIGSLVIVALIILALVVKPIRKTIGLLMVILGGIACFTIVGVVIGIPLIIIGGLFLFL